MPTIPNCFRRGASYYWRRWTPAPDRYFVQIALGVKDQKGARILSSRLTAHSDELFARWGTGAMNSQELHEYFNRLLKGTLAQPAHRSTAGNWEENFWGTLAGGYAHLLLAERGHSASLLPREAEAINGEWDNDGLALRIKRSISNIRQFYGRAFHFAKFGIIPAVNFDREPLAVDAEQGRSVELLVAAARRFQIAKTYGINSTKLEELIAHCEDPGALPPTHADSRPLEAELQETLAFVKGETTTFDLDGEIIEMSPARTASVAWLADEPLKKGFYFPDDDHVVEHEKVLHCLPRLMEVARISRADPKSSFIVAPSGSTSRLDEVAARYFDASWSVLNAPASAQGSAPNTPTKLPPADRIDAAEDQLAPEPVTTNAHKSMTFREIGDLVIANKAQDASWDQKTAKQAGALYTLFARFLAEEHGVTRMTELRQPHLYAYDQFMRALHNRYGTSSKDKERSIAQLREISRHKPKAQQGLAVATRNRHLTQLGALLAGAETMGEHVDPALNLTKLRGKRVGRARNDRPVASAAQVDAFFRTPLFVGCKDWKKLHLPGEAIFHRAAYFGPLLAHYQGMRREEYCGLSVRDVVTDNGPHPYLYIAKNDFRRIKNAQSHRNLALHSELIRLGFLDYVAAIKRAGHERLFPDLYSPSSNNLLGDRLYKELKSLRLELGISPHQFRHIFNDELKQRRVSQEFRADMLGHGGDSETTERYCNPVDISIQLEDLQKLPLRTAHIERRSIQLLPWVLRGELPPWSRAGRKKRVVK